MPQHQQYAHMCESHQFTYQKDRKFYFSHLQEPLTSLEEVVMKNRGFLDFIFLQQGELCAALGEKLYLYVNHSGMVRESKAKIREELNKYKRLQNQSSMI